MQKLRIIIFFILLPKLTLGQNIENGKRLYGQCIQCHGSRGEGVVSEQAPKIGGQYDWYIISQINAFLTGARKNPKMMPFIEGLNKQNIADLAAYITTMN